MTPNLTERQLQELTEHLCDTWFGVDFYSHVTFNHRLRTTGGRYFKNDNHIEINPKMEAYGYGVLIGIIKHELCHYYLHIVYGGSIPDHGKQFKRLLERVGGSRYAPTPEHVYKHFYQCVACQTIYPMGKRIRTDDYRCRCGGRLVEVAAPDKDDARLARV